MQPSDVTERIKQLLSGRAPDSTPDRAIEWHVRHHGSRSAGAAGPELPVCNLCSAAEANHIRLAQRYCAQAQRHRQPRAAAASAGSGHSVRVVTPPRVTEAKGERVVDWVVASHHPPVPWVGGGEPAKPCGRGSQRFLQLFRADCAENCRRGRGRQQVEADEVRAEILVELVQRPKGCDVRRPRAVGALHVGDRELAAVVPF
mmetsp:Transcript_5046/g.13074  ORF Transcript_5046/g.13074 Transcript_5046/m.13074 type:complete len:202 (-) Transcript_5046:554-1159(-)|eukprot:CAMPEP_0179843070 /NCGR_PEP_ID=MMETSP0982-20121206/3492_1 /TAXON_ID=483367 /ORGANISM="non described non described, Strain CCMP 2436" /LENGTH=201 /DNA_ID=CAMNT_0021727441 /DNA_START=160 /DNA_END=765 /DNA_ORIENTATION=+